MKKKYISREMNKFLHGIHEDFLFIYKYKGRYYSIDNDIYVYKGLLNFKYFIDEGRKVVIILDNYVNYVMKQFRDNNISYVVIEINRGYDKIIENVSLENNYRKYLLKGKRIIKNENRVLKVIRKLKISDDILKIKELEEYLNNGSYL